MGTGSSVIQQLPDHGLVIQWGKDLSRSIDYLETRPDIDVSRLAYHGVSYGIFFGPTLTYIERRFKTSVFVAGGLSPERPSPDIDAFYYLPRNKPPPLLIIRRTH